MLPRGFPALPASARVRTPVRLDRRPALTVSPLPSRPSARAALDEVGAALDDLGRVAWEHASPGELRAAVAGLEEAAARLDSARLAAAQAVDSSGVWARDRGPRRPAAGVAAERRRASHSGAARDRVTHLPPMAGAAAGRPPVAQRAGLARRPRRPGPGGPAGPRPRAAHPRPAPSRRPGRPRPPLARLRRRPRHRRGPPPDPARHHPGGAAPRRPRGPAVRPAPGRAAWIGPVSGETARRIACDATAHPLLVDPQWQPLAYGRAARVVPPALRRAIAQRDGGCRFAGCDRPAPWCDAHHLTHWAHGGKTDPDNLALVCSYHHHLLHEGGYTLTRTPHGCWTTRRPDGTAIPDPSRAHDHQPGRPGGTDRPGGTESRPPP